MTHPLDSRPLIVALAGPNGAGKSTFFQAHGLDSVETCEQRVAMRVLQGGHDVPPEKLAARFDRTLANLHRAISALPYVHVFDNSDLRRPFRRVAEFEGGKPVRLFEPMPEWLKLR